MNPWSPQATTGLNPGYAPATSAAVPALHGSGGPSGGSQAPMWHPDHPLFWVGGLVLVTFGFIGANSAVRIGKFKARVDAGTT